MMDIHNDDNESVWVINCLGKQPNARRINHKIMGHDGHEIR
jgi:hypothetical protein